MKIVGKLKGLTSLILGSCENLYLYPQTLESLILRFDSDDVASQDGSPERRLVGGSCPQLQHLTINAEMASSMPLGLGVIMTILESRRWKAGVVHDGEADVREMAKTSEQARRLEEIDLGSMDTRRKLIQDQLESLAKYVPEGLSLTYESV